MPNANLKEPVVLNDDHRYFLNDLRDSGEINMFASSPYVQAEFGLDKYEARSIVRQWMDELSK